MIRRIPEAWRIPVVSLITVLMLSLVWTVWSRVHAATVLAGIDLAASGGPDVAIVTRFTPERFHLQKFQALGRYQGWTEDGAVVLAADPAGLRQLAGNYWVRAIRPYPVQP